MVYCLGMEGFGVQGFGNRQDLLRGVVVAAVLLEVARRLDVPPPVCQPLSSNTCPPYKSKSGRGETWESKEVSRRNTSLRQCKTVRIRIRGLRFRGYDHSDKYGPPQVQNSRKTVERLGFRVYGLGLVGETRASASSKGETRASSTAGEARG